MVCPERLVGVAAAAFGLGVLIGGLLPCVRQMAVRPGSDCRRRMHDSILKGGERHENCNLAQSQMFVRDAQTAVWNGERLSTWKSSVK